MNVDSCWSTVICNASERAAVGYTGREWALQCRLSSGHDGNHATDGDRNAPPVRRRWLEWTDFSEYPHSVHEHDPCPVAGRSGAPCQFHAGHGGMHFYAPGAGLGSSGSSGSSASTSISASMSGRVDDVVGTTTSSAKDYRGGHRLADGAAAPKSEPSGGLNGASHRRVDTIERIDETIRESMELLASEPPSAEPSGEILISEALRDVAAALERLAQAYRSVGR